MQDDTQMYLRDALRDFTSTLNEHLPDADYSLFFGTLLGFHRGGDIIPWDGDIDIIFPKKYKNELIDLIEDKEKHFGDNFIRRVRCKWRLDDMIVIYREVPDCATLMPPNGRKGWTKCRVTIDICFYTESDGEVIICPIDWVRDRRRGGCNRMPRDRDPNKDDVWISHTALFPRESIFPVRESTMQDFLVKVPNDPHACLTQTYGDYMIPRFSTGHKGGVPEGVESGNYSRPWTD
jgi:hypothetical protein